MPKNLTSDLVKTFYTDATTKYSATIVNKQDSELMKLVGTFLDGIGVVDKQKFMERFTTTIGSRIYIPFVVGVEAAGYYLWDQVEILVHELVHVRQYHQDAASFMTKYLVDRSDRTTYEAEAYGTDVEMHWWNRGFGRNVKDLAQTLLNYGLTQEHCDYAAQYLTVLNDTLAQGGEINDVAIWAKRWLENHGVIPDCR